MKNENDWADPNGFSLTFRCTSKEYANLFVESGSIKFNTPSSWVEYAISNSEGRGDALEGTFAIHHIFDIERMKQLNEKYKNNNNLIRMPLDEKVYLKNRRSMELPCYCLYIMKNSMFKCPNNEGLHKLVTNVPGSYFRDFMDNLSPKDVDMLSAKEKPALIVINDFDEFKRRLLKYLLNIGLDESEIIFSRVNYIDFNKYGETGWFDFGNNFPNELTVKSTRFENQSEARIIINTNKKSIKDFLVNTPISIGPMKDIASVCEGYMYEGMQIEMDADVVIKDDDE